VRYTYSTARAAFRAFLTVACGLAPIVATAQGGSERDWFAVSSQIQGNTTSCPTGGEKARLRTDGKSLSMWNLDGNRQRWLVQLKPDGSVDTETDWTSDRISGRVRIKAPAGDGPRPVEFLYLKAVCGYRFDPTR